MAKMLVRVCRLFAAPLHTPRAPLSSLSSAFFPLISPTSFPSFSLAPSRIYARQLSAHTKDDAPMPETPSSSSSNSSPSADSLPAASVPAGSAPLDDSLPHSAHLRKW